MEVEYHEVSRASHCICSYRFPIFSRTEPDMHSSGRHGWMGGAGVRAELERGAALHLRLAARQNVAQGPRLPLPRYVCSTRFKAR